LTLTVHQKQPIGRKTDFFQIFFRFHIFTSKRSFFVSTKISYLQQQFLDKNSPQAEQFFFEFFSVAHLLFETKLFVFIKIRYKSVTNKQQTNKQTKNKRNTTDDHNTPPGFFQNPWANYVASIQNILIHDKN
jgi:hypothetical protein